MRSILKKYSIDPISILIWGTSFFCTFHKGEGVNKSGNLGPILGFFLGSDEGGETLQKMLFFGSFLSEQKTNNLKINLWQT